MPLYELRVGLKFAGCVFTVLAGLAFCAPTAKADSDAAVGASAAPDESGRPFPSDRPGRASGSYTVDVGQYEIESDLVNGMYDHWSPGGTTTTSFVVADPEFKAGLTHDIDLEFIAGGYQTYKITERATGQTTHASGAGDDLVRMKFNVSGNDGSALGIGIIPYVKLPLASASLRNAGVANNRVEGGVAAPMTYNLPNDFIIGYQPEIDANKNADDGNFHASFVNITSISHPVPGVDNLSAGLEFYSNVNTSRSNDDPNIYTIDPNMAYMLTPKLQFDVETDIGLNKAAPDIQAICGFAWLF